MDKSVNTVDLVMMNLLYYFHLPQFPKAFRSPTLIINVREVGLFLAFVALHHLAN